LNSVKEVVILGGSNAFWEISELIYDINTVKLQYKIIAVLDDSPNLIGNQLGEFIVDGPLEKAKEFSEDVYFVFAIGSFRTRLIRNEILKRLAFQDERYVTLIHPTSKIFSTAQIGQGCIVHYGTVVFNHTKVESFCVIAANCVIAVSNLLGRGCLFGSNVTTTTGVKIGSFSFIGSSTSIVENVEIGPGAQIGMASLVLKDIPAGAFVLGNPPRLLDKVEVSDEIIENWKQIIIENGYS
jgi:acetyltransferase EpsM